MDQKSVQCRLYRNNDYAAALDMVLRTWQYEEWVPEKAVKAMGEFYLADVLSESSRIWVAEVSGVPVGIAAVKNNRRKIFRPGYRFRRLLAGARILLGGQGRTEFLQFIKMEALDKELLSASGMEFDAELTFLVVDPDYKGWGIGGRLYRLFTDYLKYENLNSFYLFTDSSCDFTFYEHKGLKRLAAKTFYWAEEADGEEVKIPEEYYLYGIKTSKLEQTPLISFHEKEDAGLSLFCRLGRRLSIDFAAEDED